VSEPQELQEFLAWKPIYPDILIGDGLLYQQNKAILYGKYKSLKSMLTLNLMLSLANGKEWLGFATNPQGASVVYLQLEMPHSLLHKRVVKMIQGWSSKYRAISDSTKTIQPIWIWSEPYLKLDRPEGIKTVETYLEKYRPGLLILDPLYKLMSGNILDPNSVRTVVDNIDLLIDRYKCAVLLAHHPRKSAIDTGDMDWGSDDMLGAAVFSWWADTVMKITRKGEKDRNVILQLNFDVVRYAEDELEDREVIFNRETLLFDPVQQVIKI